MTATQIALVLIERYKNLLAVVRAAPLTNALPEAKYTSFESEEFGASFPGQPEVTRIDLEMPDVGKISATEFKVISRDRGYMFSVWTLKSKNLTTLYAGEKGVNLWKNASLKQSENELFLESEKSLLVNQFPSKELTLRSKNGLINAKFLIVITPNIHYAVKVIIDPKTVPEEAKSNFLRSFTPFKQASGS